MAPNEPKYSMQEQEIEGQSCVRVRVNLPKVKSMETVELHVDHKGLSMHETSQGFSLDLDLPQEVFPDFTKAVFRKKRHELLITLPYGTIPTTPRPPPISELKPPTSPTSTEQDITIGESATIVEAKLPDPEEQAKADEFKVKGNALLSQGKFQEAITMYTQALAICETAIYYANRASAYIKLEMHGMAINDASCAIEIDPTYVKGYFRRGTAHVAQNRPEEALPDFEAAIELCPSSKEAKLHLRACQEMMKRKHDEELAQLANQSHKPLINMDPNDIPIEESYSGPHMDADGPTAEFAEAMMECFRNQEVIHKRYAVQILQSVRDYLATLPSLIDVSLPPQNNSEITVCGDTHGQFYDLLHIFDINGRPSPENPYVFNGDFVDRGSFSVETAMTLLTYKLVYPDGIFLTRGNHESQQCNAMYGFEGEVKTKYGPDVMALFTEVFNRLPLAVCIENKVLVLHGGLFDQDGVTLDDIRNIDRIREPPIEGLMCDLLWADPMYQQGRAPSKRGVSCMFGPDITRKFLDDNNLERLVRSHEVKPSGYEVMHDGRCITVFSAPNYCDQMGNQGAFIRFGSDMEPKFTSYDAAPHPNIPPMMYQEPSFLDFYTGGFLAR